MHTRFENCFLRLKFQTELDAMKEIERQLHKNILKEKEESLKSHKQHEQHVQAMLSEKHDLDMKLAQARAEIQSHVNVR